MQKLSYQKTITDLTRKGINFTFRDRRKVVSLIIVLLLPLIGKLWIFVPPEIEFPYYGYLQPFLYSFSVNFISVLIAVAWFLSIHRKDFALQIIALAAIFYGLFMTYDTLPFTMHTPLWTDISAIAFVFVCVGIYLFYIHRNYLNSIMDYKVLHDGIVHDLHHQRFLGELSRIEGLIEIAEMDEQYRDMCKKEIAKLKESVTYIADKYSELK
jgi:hypothetical protein